MNDTTCRWFHRLFPALALTIASCVAGAGEVRFNRDIRPILSDKCFKCHGPDANHRKADLRLDTLEGALADLGDYAAVVPGAPGKSELIARITTGDEDDVMPPPDTGKTLSDDEKKLFRDWIAEGGEYEAHWAYIPPKRPSMPTVSARAWPSGAIDRFILARIESANFSPSPQADAATLARRLHFDLTGLPPSPRWPSAWPATLRRRRTLGWCTSCWRRRGSASAWRRIGSTSSVTPTPSATTAIRITRLPRTAIGSSRRSTTTCPFDQFTAEQLAGDLLPNATMNQKIASGYNRLLQTSHEGGVQKKEYLAKYSADRVRNVSNAWLGATMGCSECHDHKYDPITQKDFTAWRRFCRCERRQDLQRHQHAPHQARAGVAGRLAAGCRAGQAHAHHGHRRIKPRTIRVLPRGNWMDDSGEIVEPAVPHFLPVLKNGSRANRLDLAEWLTSADNPLTARVFVNRLWYLLFGSGLSSTLDDTGSQGEWPTHPGLLDWLAVEFVESGWDVKHIVRLIVTSSAYRQSSLVSPQLREHDPENRLFMRQGRFRLQAETIRDNALAVGGLLNYQMGGKVAKPYQPAGYYSPMNFPKRKYSADMNANQYRRGVYVHWQRQFLHPMLARVRRANARGVHRAAPGQQHAAGRAHADERSDIRRGGQGLRTSHPKRGRGHRSAAPGLGVANSARPRTERQGTKRGQGVPRRNTQTLPGRRKGSRQVARRRHAESARRHGQAGDRCVDCAWPGAAEPQRNHHSKLTCNSLHKK